MAEKPKKKKEYIRISATVPSELNNQFEKLRTKIQLSRSDAIRRGMRLLINQNLDQLIEPEDIEVLGTISYIEKAHVHSLEPLHDPSHNSPQGASHFHPHSSEKIHKTEHEHKHEPEPEKEDENDHHHQHNHQPAKSTEQYYFPVDQVEFIQINELQHHFLDEIISTTHIHASKEKCMIIIAVKGKMHRINELLQRLQSFHTIQNLQFIPLEKISKENKENPKSRTG